MSILNYFPIILLLFASFFPEASQAQKNPSPDTLKVKPFIRIGLDLSPALRYALENEVRELEIALDTEVKRNWFATAEMGIMQVEANKPDFQYQAQGYFGRIGLDFNLLRRPDERQNDLVLLGFRYAYIFLDHQSDRYIAPSPYWGEHLGSVQSHSFQAHWIELTAGVKTEVFRNFFLGWSLRSRIKLSETSDPAMQPYYIGGYGKGNRKAPVMVHYSVLYRIGF